MAGDGASLDGELRERVRFLLQQLTEQDLTAQELRELKAIYAAAAERIRREQQE